MGKKKTNSDTKSKLTNKQERFCYEYCIDFNATKAAIRAGYSVDTAQQMGAENLSKPVIQNRIKHMKDNLAETAGISAMMVLREHQKIAFSSIAHLHNTWIERVDFEELTDEHKSCIKSISTKIVKKNIGTREEPDIVDIEYVKIEMYDKQKSLESINKMLGFDAPIKQEINTNVNVKPIPLDKAKTIVDELRKGE